MSDTRWFEIEADTDIATRHFSGAAAIIASRTRDQDAKTTNVARMAFLQAMHSAHTSMERSLIRVIDLLGEERPSGARWQDELIRVAATPLASRPAILEPDLAAAALETRKFRDRAIHADEGSNHDPGDPAVRAAALLAGGLRGAIAAFRHAIDP